jgi:hypothetical protein
MTSRFPSLLGLLAVVLVPGLACQKTPSDATPAATGTAAVRASASPSPNAPVYSGPTGSVEGVVTMEGDEPPTLDAQASKIPSSCTQAQAMFSRLFREGAGRTVADVFVAVTGYKGNVVEPAPAQKVEARGCAWDRRTIGVYGTQRLDVRSVDDLAYVPELIGATTKSMLVAVPHGEEIPVFTRGVGHYILVDGMRNFNKADVLVVRYPTFQITGLDGRFHIANLPVGKATVTAFLPMANLKAETSIEIMKDAAQRTALTLRFDRAVYDAVEKSTKPQPSSDPKGATSAALKSVPSAASKSATRPATALVGKPNAAQ